MLIEKLKEMQQKNNWSQEELAKKLGVSRSLIAATFTGKRRPGIKLYSAALRQFPALENTIINCLKSGDDY